MTHEALMWGLKANLEVLENLIDCIPESQLAVKRGVGIWSIYEHVNHLALVQHMLFGRLELFVKEDKPEIKPYIPDQKSESNRSKNKPIRDQVAFFSKWRTRQIELIETCEPDLWSKTASHPEYTLYTLEILVRHILLHDGFHMYRIEELWLAKDAYLTEM
jgi:uncharacterized damage-inducible protein DinB